MSAFVVSHEHIAAMVTAADRIAAASHAQFDWYAKVDGEDVRFTLSRTGVDAIEDAYTVQVTPDYAHRYPEHRTLSFDALGGLLLAENVRSVCHRYPADDLDETPGYIGQSRTLYRHRAAYVATVAALKAVQCYAYQSCEHPEWETSPAAAFCQQLTRALIDDLPGYDEAPWGIDAGNLASITI